MKITQSTRQSTRRFKAKLKRAQAEYQYDKECGIEHVFSHYIKDFKIGVSVKDILIPYFDGDIDTEDCYKRIVNYWRMKELKKRNRAQLKASCTAALEKLQAIYNANHDDWKELFGIEVKLEVIQPEKPVDEAEVDKELQAISQDLFGDLDDDEQAM